MLMKRNFGQPRLSPQNKHIKPPALKETTPGEKQKLCSKTFTQEVFSILHSSPVEEDNGILDLQSMGPPPFKEMRATSPFSED
jgi:hypothetical protein